MHFGSGAAVCVLGGGGGCIKGQAFNVIGLRYLTFLSTMLHFIGVYSIIFDY